MAWTNIEKLEYGKDLRDSAVADYGKTNEVIDSLNGLGAAVDINVENIKNNSDNIDTLAEWTNTAETDITNLKIADTTLGNRISANTNDISTNKSSIENMKGDVSTALSNSETAKTAAESAKSTAEVVDSRVSTYDTKIATATTNAETAKTAAESAKTTAESFKTAIDTNTTNIKTNSDNIDEIAEWTNTTEITIKTHTGDIAALKQTVSELKLLDTVGDEITLTNYSCGGFVTSASQQIRFAIPLAHFYNSDVTGVVLKAGTTAKFTVRQNAKYCFGSSASASVTGTLSYASYQQTGIVLWFQFSDTTNAVNNDACGIAIESMTLVLS